MKSFFGKWFKRKPHTNTGSPLGFGEESFGSIFDTVPDPFNFDGVDDVLKDFSVDFDNTLEKLNKSWDEGLNLFNNSSPYKNQSNNKPHEKLSKIERVNNSVCVISGFRKVDGEKQRYTSHGVFITPFHVLTAWHCVAGLKGTEFENIDGKKAKSLKSGWNRKNETLDLAIVEINDPIGTSYNLILTRDSFKPDVKGWLVTRFNGFPQKHEVKLDTYSAMNRKDGNVVFKTDVWVGKGYSGSPVVNEEGRIISVATLIEGSEEELADLERKKGSFVKGDGEQAKFLGPLPNEFAGWVQKAFVDYDL